MATNNKEFPNLSAAARVVLSPLEGKDPNFTEDTPAIIEEIVNINRELFAILSENNLPGIQTELLDENELITKYQNRSGLLSLITDTPTSPVIEIADLYQDISQTAGIRISDINSYPFIELISDDRLSGHSIVNLTGPGKTSGDLLVIKKTFMLPQYLKLIRGRAENAKSGTGISFYSYA